MHLRAFVEFDSVGRLGAPSLPVGKRHSFCFDCPRTRRILYGVDPTLGDGVDELLQTYSETGGINYLDAAATLRSRLTIEAACAELMSLLFPGFRSEAIVNSADLADVTRSRMRNLHARLKTEICKSLGKLSSRDKVEEKAEDILSGFQIGRASCRE